MEIHQNFVNFVKDTFAEMKREISPECQDFLKKDATEMVSNLKLLLTAMPMEAVQALVMNRLAVERKDIPVARLEKLNRYSEYFVALAQNV